MLPHKDDRVLTPVLVALFSTVENGAKTISVLDNRKWVAPSSRGSWLSGFVLLDPDYSAAQGANGSASRLVRDPC
jgi:hypothetical protein